MNMQLDKQGIIEYVKKAIIELRSEGKIDMEKTMGTSTRLKFYQELYPNKISATIRIEEDRFPGSLDKMIAEGIRQGLLEPIKELTLENVELSDSDYNDIEWDVRMELAKRGLDSTSLEYQQASQKLFEELEAKRLEEKKAELAAKQKSKSTDEELEVEAEKIVEEQIYSEAEQEIVNALTYVEDLKVLLKDPQAVAQAFTEIDQEFMLVWQRLERQGQPKETIITEVLAEVAPSRPKQEKEKKILAKRFWQNYGQLIGQAAKENKFLAEKLRDTYRNLQSQGLPDEQAKRETYWRSLRSKEPIVAQARKDAYAILWPQPIELRFKRSFRKCRKPSQPEKSPLPRGEALKVALERALNMAPSLREKKSVLDKMSQEHRAFMPSAHLKRRKTP